MTTTTINLPSLAAAAAKIWRRVRQLPAHAYASVEDVVMRVPLSSFEPSKFANTKAAATCKVMSISDIPALGQVFGDERVRPFTRRLQSGAIGCVAWVDGVPAGFSWMTRAKRRREGEYPFFYDIDPGHKGAYLFDTLVASAYRGQGLALSLKIWLLTQAKAAGVDFVFSTHDIRNEAILRVIRKLGFYDAGHLRYCRRLLSVKRDVRALQTVTQQLGDKL